VANPEAIIEELRETCDVLTQQISTQASQISTQAGQISTQASEIARLQATVTFFEEQHRLALHRQFGRSSEQAPVGQEALLFNEAETFSNPTEPEPPVEEVVKPRTKKKPGQRSEQVANLEVREQEHPATPEQQLCPCCGEQMEFVDWQVRQEVEYVPAKAILVHHKQPILACRPCQLDGESAPIKTIKTMPEPPFPRSLASASLVSHIIIQKFVMGAPVYRQEHNMENLGVYFSRQTMCNWLMRAADLMQPLYDRMHQILLTQDIAHADETTVQVLREPGRAADTDSTMWLYRSGRAGPAMALFDYQLSRAGKYAREFLSGFGGYDPDVGAITRKKYLHTDGHEAYSCVAHVLLVDGLKEYDIILVGCWAHARRKFHEALQVVKPQDRKSGKRIAAAEGLKLCDDLFDLEREFKDMTAEERHAARLERSVPKLTEIKTWLDKASIDVLPKSTTGQAVGYCLNQWIKLNTFLLDGRLDIDNNRAERTIRQFVIGRRNWIFANTPQGARSSATLYSIIESAKENQLIPFAYVNHLLERLPNIDTKDPNAMDALLPWSKEIPDDCRR
jgi:transposase